MNVEKVLHGESWTYDRHLVALEQYNDQKLVNEISFCNTTFWVQVHDLPFSLLTRKVALSLGATLGTVIMHVDNSEMQRGNFVLVRVMVDISKPLSRGWLVSWDQDKEGWVSYKEGWVSCVVWLSSRGSLSTEDKQYKSWLRAP